MSAGDGLVACESTFERLVADDPARLISWIADGSLPPHFLTYAAEYAGSIPDSEVVRGALVPLLDHPQPIVREGAIIGLSRYLDDDRTHIDPPTIVRLRVMAANDPSPGVRRSAAGALEEVCR